MLYRHHWNYIFITYNCHKTCLSGLIVSCHSPTPKVKWIKMGDKLPPRTKFDNFGKQLTLSAVENGDGGKYMCTAKNSAGEAVHYFDVIVEGRSIAGARCAWIWGAFIVVSKRKKLTQGLMCFWPQTTHFLHLPEPPKWLTEPPQNQLTINGSDVHIKCSVTGKPLPDITWRRNGVLFRGE